MDCLTCDGSSDTDCLTCNTAGGFDLDPVTHQCKCRDTDAGIFYNPLTHTCATCDPKCTTCEFESIYCYGCISHYYLHGTRCKICHPTCIECIAELDINCISCQPHLTYNPVTKKCECNQVGKFLDASYLCATCDPKCVECKVISTYCQSCAAGYFLYNNECIGTCPSQYFPSNDLRRCILCNDACLECGDATDLTCVDCNTLYYR